MDVAENGKKAIDMVDAHQYDLILMDLHMPVMDGYQASTSIHTKYPRLPIVALTASVLAEGEENLASYGITECVIKPFHPHDFKSKLIKVLS
jgi:CheY-like chemotaxis protein